MSTLQLLDLREIPPDMYTFTLYAQGMQVCGIHYEVLFLPLAAGWFSYEGAFRQEVRDLPEGAYEIKFALKDDVDAGGPNFHTPQELGYPPLTRKEFQVLGEGLMQSIRVFDKTLQPSAYVAVALDDRPGLSRYYDRLVVTYNEQITSLGLRFQQTMKGQGYAFLRN
ncbi:hypothetical protein FXN65_23965 [Metapseudomonas lalkuanensis]|uniref:Uncharacterized protein n=1 Tax=Metapseudomonas lalkuanensis TaxID=2604832 RepID=A0A5J6QVV0_9GAMM|nr:hypothetical protein [Pseudomonas lalkuanensis]QEY64966.1 hypothetical protein FXN65_23965 [Pseudomonas lalkuanensis]